MEHGMNCDCESCANGRKREAEVAASRQRERETLERTRNLANFRKRRGPESCWSCHACKVDTGTTRRSFSCWRGLFREESSRTTTTTVCDHHTGSSTG